MKIIATIARAIPFVSRKASDLAHKKAAEAHADANYLRDQLAQAHRANVRLRNAIEEDSIGNHA